MKQDPYKLLQRLALILAIAIAAGIGVFYLCSVAVTRDYINTRNRINAENQEGQAAFDQNMQALRAQREAEKQQLLDAMVVPDENLPGWEKELAGKVWRVQDEGSAGLENASTISMERHQLMNGGLGTATSEFVEMLGLNKSRALGQSRE